MPEAGRQTPRRVTTTLIKRAAEANDPGSFIRSSLWTYWSVTRFQIQTTYYCQASYEITLCNSITNFGDMTKAFQCNWKLVFTRNRGTCAATKSMRISDGIKIGVNCNSAESRICC